MFKVNPLTYAVRYGVTTKTASEYTLSSHLGHKRTGKEHSIAIGRGATYMSTNAGTDPSIIILLSWFLATFLISYPSHAASAGVER